MSGASAGLKRLGGVGKQKDVELRRFDEFLAVEKLGGGWKTPISALAVHGQYQTWLQTQGVLSHLAPREISAALKRRPLVSVRQRDPRSTPLFSLDKPEEGAPPGATAARPLPELPAPPAPARRALRGAVTLTATDRGLSEKCVSLQGRLRKMAQTLRNERRAKAMLAAQNDDLKDTVRRAGALEAKLDRTKRTLERAQWRLKSRAKAARSFRAVKGELATKVSDLGARLNMLSRVSGASTVRLETALRASAADMIAVRHELLAARKDAAVTVDAAEMHAERSAAETARLEKELEKVAGPMSLREGGVICAEVRAAAVAIAAGLEVSIGAVSPVMDVVLTMLEKLSLRQRGASLNVTASTLSDESVVRFVHEQGELEKFHTAWRVFMSTSKRAGYYCT